MKIKTLILFSFIVICLALFAHSAWRSFMMTDGSGNVSKGSKEDVYADHGAGEGVQSHLTGGAACRKVNESTGLAEWEAHGDTIEQVGEREFKLKQCQLDLFHYNDDKSLRAKIKVLAGSASIQDDAGVLTDGVRIESNDGFVMELDDATVFMEQKRIRSLSRVVITQTNVETGATDMIVRGQGFECDTSMEHFTITTVESVELLDVPGGMLGGGDSKDPVQVDCTGALTVSTPDNEIVFHDDVEVKRAESFLNCDLLRFLLSGEQGAQGGLDAAQAIGHARIRQQGEQGLFTGQGDRMEFYTILKAPHPRTGVEQDFQNVVQVSSNTGSQKNRGHMEMNGDSLDADALVVYHNDALAVATGDVQFELKPRKEEKSGDWFSGQGDDSQAWKGSCDELQIEYGDIDDSGDAGKTLRQVHMMKNAVVASGVRRIEGDEIHWNGADSRGLVIGSPARLQDVDVLVIADRVDVDRAAGRIQCSPLQEFKYRPPKSSDRKNKQWANVEEWDVRAQSATLRYDIESNDPIEVLADGNVKITGGSYVAEGDHVQWDFVSGIASLEGKPAHMQDTVSGNEVRAWVLIYRETLGEIVAHKDVALRVQRSVLEQSTKNDDENNNTTGMEWWDVNCQDASLWLGPADDGGGRQVNRLVLETDVKIRNAEVGGDCARVEWIREGNLLTAVAAEGKRLSFQKGDHRMLATSVKKTSFDRMVVSGDVEITGPWKRPDTPEEASETGILHAQTVDVLFAKDGETPLKIIAKGNPDFRQGDISAAADTMTWLEADQTLLLEGRPARVQQGPDILTATKLIYYKNENSAMGSGGVTMRFHSKKKPSIPGVAAIGYEWLVTADHFQAEFSKEQSGMDGVRSASVQGNVRMVNGDFHVRGDRFQWGGAQQRGTLYGNPLVQIKLDKNWVTGKSVTFSPLRQNGGSNHFSITGPIRGIKSPDAN